MSWPLSQDYNEAIQSPATSFADPELRTGQVQVNALGLPLPRSGNFADVYQVQCPSATWAVKCFTRQVAGQRERYSEVSRHLQAARLPFTVDFQYLEQGIRIRKQWYPILKMRWVEGLLLNAFVRDALDKPALLNQLGQIWARMAKRLREAKVAHADLQHGNVLLVPGSSASSLAVKLIDYDGMWVPALAASKSGEVGHPNYQHPQRLREGTYSPEVDRFPELVVATALRALALGGKALWQRYDNGDNLLFKEADLSAPAESALFGELRGMADPLLQKLVGTLQDAVQVKLEQTLLLEEMLPEDKTAIKGKAAVTMTASGPDWDFTGGEQPVPPRRRRREGSKVPRRAWAVGSAAAMALLMGGVFLATRGGNDDQPSPVAQGSQLQGSPPRETSPDLPPSKSGTEEPAEKKPPSDPPKPDPENKLSDSPRPDPQKPPMDPPPARPAPAGEPRKVFQVLAGKPNLLVLAPPNGKTWSVTEADAAGMRPPRQRFAGHTQAVTCVALTPDGRRALSGSEDGTVRLWDVPTGQSLRIFRGHVPRVVAVAISADGKRGLSADEGTLVRLWNLETGEVVNRFDSPNGVAALALSADGKRVLCGCASVAMKDPSVLLWDADTGQRIASFRGHSDTVLSVAFSPEERFLASGGADKRVFRWQIGFGSKNGLGSFPAAVRQVAFSPNGNVLLATAGSATSFYNFADRKGATQEVPGCDSAAACFAADGSAVWAGGAGDAFTIHTVSDPEKSVAGETFTVRTVPDAEKSTAVATQPPPPPPTPVDERLAVPAAKALAQAVKDLRDLYKDLYATKSSSLSGKLEQMSAQPEASPALRYAALKELRDMAAQKGDVAGALEYADRIGSTFRVPPREALANAVFAAGRFAHPAPVNQVIAEECLRLIPRVEAEEDYDLALRLALVVKKAAGNALVKSGLAEKAASRAAVLAAAKAEFPAVQKALAVLARDPDDAEANGKVGRFRCVFQDNWEEGLPLLARGKDEGLKTLATKDLEAPAEAAARKELGDIWWDAARKEKDKSPAQLAFARRAYDWYKLALPGLTEDQTEVKRRMGNATQLMPDLLDPWRHLDHAEGTAGSDSIHLDAAGPPGDKNSASRATRCIFTRRCYKGGIDVTVEARTAKSDIRLTAGAGGRVVFNAEVRVRGAVLERSIRFDRPDNLASNGRGIMVGSHATTSAKELTPDEWHTLRWLLIPAGTKVWADGELVLETNETYDLSTPRRVGVCSFSSPIDVKSVVVKPVPAPEGVQE
jgi:hypothetical protein